MAESYAFNMDCMAAMKEFPDKFFDLAVVDPPYGDACSQTVNVERERLNRRTTASGARAADLKSISVNL